MFFDPSDYLERDPAATRSKREAAQLKTDAEQRAKLCEAMTRMAADVGFKATKIYLAARKAGLGLSTYYKLYESKEACLLEAFEKCAEAIFSRVEEAMSSRSRCEVRVAAGIGTMVELLAYEPDVARLVLVEIRVGGMSCREAQQKWLENLAGLLTNPYRGSGASDGGGMARMVIGALASLLVPKVSAEAAGELERALPELTFVSLAPYLGAEAAVAEMRRRQEELIRSGGETLSAVRRARDL